MTIQKRRTLHAGGASWLVLCAVGSRRDGPGCGRATFATQLPEITVTAPSPIVKRKPAAGA